MAIISYLIINSYINYWVSYSLCLGLVAVFSIGYMTASIIMITGITKAVKPEFRGGTFSTVRAINQSAAVLFLIIGRLIIDFLDVTTFLIAASVLLIIFVILFWNSKHIKGMLKAVQNKVNETMLDNT